MSKPRRTAADHAQAAAWLLPLGLLLLLFGWRSYLSTADFTAHMVEVEGRVMDYRRVEPQVHDVDLQTTVGGAFRVVTVRLRGDYPHVGETVSVVYDARNPQETAREQDPSQIGKLASFLLLAGGMVTISGLREGIAALWRHFVRPPRSSASAPPPRRFRGRARLGLGPIEVPFARLSCEGGHLLLRGAGTTLDFAPGDVVALRIVETRDPERHRSVERLQIVHNRPDLPDPVTFRDDDPQAVLAAATAHGFWPEGRPVVRAPGSPVSAAGMVTIFLAVIVPEIVWLLIDTPKTGRMELLATALVTWTALQALPYWPAAQRFMLRQGRHYGEIALGVRVARHAMSALLLGVVVLVIDQSS